jgi:DMSO/TMAO reductase YedYZ molybdopterin-dependent catalytic subunit
VLKIKRLPFWVSWILILAITIPAFSCSLPNTDTNSVSTPDIETSTTGQSSPVKITSSSTDLSAYIEASPSATDNSTLPVTPIDELHVTGIAPDIDITGYRLVVDGLVNTPLSLTYEEIKQYPSVSEVVLLICYEVFADNAKWTGVPVSTILGKAGVQPQATEVTFFAPDLYKCTFNIDELQRDGVFLAYEVDGQVLPKEHGYPLRLVIQGEYGHEWIKWVDHIEVE